MYDVYYTIKAQIQSLEDGRNFCDSFDIAGIVSDFDRRASLADVGSLHDDCHRYDGAVSADQHCWQLE